MKKFFSSPRLRSFLWRAVMGAVIGGVLGYFLVRDSEILGTAVGVVLGWYLARSIWGAIVGAVFGYFFINGTSGTVAGAVVGMMVSCNIIGRKGRGIVLAVVIVAMIAAILLNPTYRERVFGLFGVHH